MYDLTSLLTTIAACSATIVAIIGGFIASQLIALNAERREAEARVEQINKNICLNTSQKEQIVKRINEEDALCFIDKHIDILLSQNNDFSCINENEYSRDKKDVFEKYWKDAQFVIAHISEILEKGENANDFDRDVLQMAKYECDRDSQQSYLRAPRMSRMTGIWYQHDISRLNELLYNNNWLSIQKEDLSLRYDSLNKPRGIKSGATLFSLFSIINIIIPLCFVPQKTSNYGMFLELKWGTIIVFAVSVFAVIAYFIFMIRWKKKK